jgi:Flp pilus assembly protein TadG
MEGNATRCRRFRRQSGATAVEFALVFPILLTLIYCGLVYSYVYMLQQAINFAVQQGVQAAVAVLPQTDGSTNSTRQAQAQLAAKSTLSWLPPGQISRFQIGTVTNCGTGQALPTNGYAVQGTFALGSSGTALFPSLVNLPLVGTIPVLPSQLSACAVAIVM